jgi:hypothetical protein
MPMVRSGAYTTARSGCLAAVTCCCGGPTIWTGCDGTPAGRKSNSAGSSGAVRGYPIGCPYCGHAPCHSSFSVDGSSTISSGPGRCVTSRPNSAYRMLAFRKFATGIVFPDRRGATGIESWPGTNPDSGLCRDGRHRSRPHTDSERDFAAAGGGAEHNYTVSRVFCHQALEWLVRRDFQQLCQIFHPHRRPGVGVVAMGLVADRN